MEKAVYSILVPVFNEEEVLPVFYGTIIPLMEKLQESFEIVFVNDGSKDKTEEILKDMATKDKRVKVVNFARNFGQQAAIHAALAHSRGDAMIVMDVDLQDPPEVAIQMIEEWKKGFEVVHGKRGKRRGETIFKKITAYFYYRFLRKITGMSIPEDTGEFKLYDRKAVDAILNLPEHNRYLRGLATWVGFKQTSIEFERPERACGVTKWTVRKMIKLAGDGIIANSAYPLYLTFKMGLFLLVSSIIAFLTFALFEILKANSVIEFAVPLTGWLFPAITLIGGLIMIYQGFSNLYISRIYDEVKQRPIYIVREIINIE